MNYTIFSIDDRRDFYTGAIRAQLSTNFWWNEVPTWCVDGNDSEALYWAQDVHKYKINAHGIKKGQLGIWYTVLNALSERDDHPFVTFEDDAILHPDFTRLFWDVTSWLPRDTDAFSLFLPRDQDHVYQSNPRRFDVRPGIICQAYQRYGGVSMLWTPRGADKFRKLLRRDGITGQWDDQLYEYAHKGEMNVFTQPPSREILVGISGSEESIVQETEEWKS